MKRWMWVVAAGVVGVILVGVLVIAGLFVFGRNLVWGARPFGMHDTWGWATPWSQCGPSGRRGFWGPGMMGRPGMQSDACEFYDRDAVQNAENLTLEEARQSFEAYLSDIGYGDLEVTEVMEYEFNFYAIAKEPDTGMGAMEILLDKQRGAIGPEPGPNMMWNGRYGMHSGSRGMMGGMMGQAGVTNRLSEDEALAYARAWAERERPPLSVDEHGDEFYGYYTFHTVRDGEIEGMLSVHGSSGDVWYHSWHGDFIAMLSADDH
jgi:hypothetical protein